MNFMSKSKSYLLTNEEKSIKKRISFGITNTKAVYTDNSISFPESNNSGCILQKIHSHEHIENLNSKESAHSIADLTPVNKNLLKSSMNILSQSSTNNKTHLKSDSVNLLSLEFKPPSIISSLVSPVSIGYRSKLSRLMKNRLNKSQINLEDGSFTRKNSLHNLKENQQTIKLNENFDKSVTKNKAQLVACETSTSSPEMMGKSFRSITSSYLVDESDTIESLSNKIKSLNDSIGSDSNQCTSIATSSKIDCKHDDIDLQETTNEPIDFNNKSPDLTKSIGEQLQQNPPQSNSKLSKLNRSISSSILSINKFKRKKVSRQSINNDQNFEMNSILLPGCSLTTRKSFTSKNLIKQIENLHGQAEYTNNGNKTLDILINIYNSELSYLSHLKDAFEIYAEPLRKFSSLTSQEYNLLFANLEPIISLSCNLSIKLENQINNFSPYDIENSGNFLGKKLFECYEEYINSYSSIVKLLNQKFKQNEIRELCELRQSKSNCLSLHEILSLPLERIIYYQKLESDLIDSYEDQRKVLKETYSINTDLSERVLIQDTDSEFIQETLFKTEQPIIVSFPENDTIPAFNSRFLNQSKSAHKIDSLESYQHSNLITRNKSVGDILYQDNDFIESWKQITEKSESLVNLVNDQMSDSTNISRLASLASIQQTFPNDNLKLFDETITPTKFNQNTVASSSSLTQTVKSGLEKMSKFNLINATPVTTTGKISIFNTIKKSDTVSSRELFSAKKKLSESYDTSTKTPNKLVRTPTITTSAESHIVTTLNSKHNLHKKKSSASKQFSNGTNRTPSFVSKHFQIQRRKTIHDIVNFEILNNIVPSESSPTDYDLPSSNMNIHKYKINTVRLNKMQLLEEKFPEATNDINEENENDNQIQRTLIRKTHAQLLNQYDKQDRHLFLFNDLLIIAKQKSETHNKLKHRVLVGDIWLSDCFDTIYWQYKAESSIVIGWPPAHNFIVDFKDPMEKESWLKQLKQLIAVEKRKEEGLHLNIKICFNKDNFGGSEPTQFSESFTKTVQVRTNETAQDIVNRCKFLFNLEHQQSKNNVDAISNSNYQLWLKSGKNEPLIPLIGHEFPYVIKMNYLREVGRSIKDDDNSHKFILIDKNARKASSSANQHINNNNVESNKSSNRLSSNLNTVSTVNNTVSDFLGTQNKEIDIEADKLQKLRKKFFGNRTNMNENSTNNTESSLAISKQPVFKSASVEVKGVPQNSKKAENKLLNSFKKSEAQITSSGSMLQFRSTSLSHSGSYKQQRSESVNVVKNFGLQNKNETELLMNHTKILNINNYSQSITNSTLKPFYNKLKRTHLFGVKLEKFCGVYSHSNCKLPAQIMNLLEKVSDEGQSALMIFRKSASAKQKKYYKDKLDSNQVVDFNEMNVHVAALLLKEYLREYPDGIIDYHLYNDCLAILKIDETQFKLAKTKLLLAKLQRWNLLCLRYFMCLFCIIVNSSQVNKMDSHNLSVCVAPSIFHKLDRPSDVESSFQAIAFIKHLIDNCVYLFGEDTLCLLKPGYSNLESEQEYLTIDTEPTTTTTAAQKKHTKSTIKIHRKEIGRMLNFALKGKKTSKSKSKFQNGQTETAIDGNISPVPTIKIIQKPLEIKVAEDVIAQENKLEVPIFIVNSPTREIEDEELVRGFNKIELNKEIRRRTSTNNSEQKAEFNTMLVVNVEGDHDGDLEDHEQDFNNSGEDEDVDDEEVADENSDQEDYFTYNDDIVSAETGNDCSNDDGITVDYGLSSKAKSNMGCDISVNKLNELAVVTSSCGGNTDSNNETSLSVNNLVINKHDLSSNTLSVDSGLSVPTATNSDPESEKSTNFNNRNTSESVMVGSCVGAKESMDLLDASRLKKELEKHQQSADYCLLGSDLAGDKQPPLLKRQRRMLILNSTNTNLENNLADIYNDQTKNSDVEVTKKLSESESDGINKNIRRISSTRMAPLAPPLLKYFESSESAEEAKLAMTTDQNNESKAACQFVKIYSQNKVKQLAPMATIDSLKIEPESDDNSPNLVSRNQQKTSTNSFISTKSTSTFDQHTNKNQKTTSTTVYYSNQHYHRSKQQSTSNNRKQMAKVCLNPETIADMINFNSLINDGAVQEGYGVAWDLKLSNNVEGSSTTVYVPFIPKENPASSLNQKQSQRRKLSKTIRDYKPSRQLQRQLSHQQKDKKLTPGLTIKLQSHSFKQLKNQRRNKSQIFDSTSDRDSSTSSTRSQSKKNAVIRAKSLNSQLKNLTLSSNRNQIRPLVKRTNITQVHELNTANASLIDQVEATPEEINNVTPPISVCLSLSSSNKTTSLSSASSSSILSGQTKNEVNNNNHSINLNSKFFKQTKPLIIENIHDKSTKHVVDADGKSVEVTWSVSSIRKQFEEFSDQSSDHSKSSQCQGGSIVKINRHSVMQHPQNHQSSVSVNSKAPHISTSSFSSVSSNSASKCYNYHDSNGNPITYI